MKLQKLTASFGTLDGKTLTLGDGLNIIYAPNEGGKSTWAGFLRTMLYGIDTRDRDKKGHLADKNRFQPWSGAPMEGELCLQWGGRDIVLRRGARGATPFGNFSAVYAQTGAPIASLTGADCGNILVGVGREVYEQSAFIGSGLLSVSSTPELEKRISALISTGQEEISYSQVEGQLKEWLRLRKHNNTGIIPRLEGELAEVGQKLRDMTQINGEIATYTAEKMALSVSFDKFKSQMDAHQQIEAHTQNLRYTEAHTALTKSQNQLALLEQERSKFGTIPTLDRLRHWQGELSFLKTLEKELRGIEQNLDTGKIAVETAQKDSIDPRFQGLSGQAAVDRANRDRERYLAALTQQAGAKKRPILLSVLTAVAVAGVGSAVVMEYLPQTTGLYGMVAIAVAGIISITIALSRQKKQGAVLQSILQPYDIKDITEMLPLADAYRDRRQVAEQAEDALRQMRIQFDSQTRRKETGWTGLREFIHTFAPEVNDFFGCSAALSRALHMGDELAVVQTRVEGDMRLVKALAEQGGSETAETLDIAAPQELPHQISARISAVQDELERISHALSQCIGRQQAMGDPASLSAHAEQISEALARRRQEYDGIAIALDALKEANIQLQERFSPQLNQRASLYLEQLTGGKYTALTLNRELEGMATETGAILPRAALSLSRGTADQLYLAVRLAVCDLCIPVAESVPLVLDDALIHFDNKRMGHALDLLRQMGRERQIVLFTCQKREGIYCENQSDVTQISL